MSIAFNGMPIGVTASSKIILLTNIIFKDNLLLFYSGINPPYSPRKSKSTGINRLHYISIPFHIGKYLIVTIHNDYNLN